MKAYSAKFWLIVGSQDLYGQETLHQVNAHAREMGEYLDTCNDIPCGVEYAAMVTTPAEIADVCIRASAECECAGVILWMHTFSPSKMWITGLKKLTKPILHLHTQYNREIPFDSIDMDFMNLNQSAHGDREHGHIGAKMRLGRKVIAGYWKDKDVTQRMGRFIRMALGKQYCEGLQVARFGDNMREVAVTDGDKVQAEINLGWRVNGYGIGELKAYMDAASDADVSAVMDEYNELYTMNTDDLASVKYQARIEAGLARFLKNGGFSAFTTNFETLHGMQQLPGLAVQNLMRKGYGFGAEGDWKTSALVAAFKYMSKGLAGGTSFMEDYTYHLEKGRELVLGAHMLEVCPSIADGDIKIEVHGLGIGGKDAPARLVFDGAAGDAVQVTLIDMGGRFRMIASDCKAAAPIAPMPKLPVARVMWAPAPSFQIATEGWIQAGGAHHTVMTYALKSDDLKDFAAMFDIEFVHIGQGTDVGALMQTLKLNDLLYKLR